ERDMGGRYGKGVPVLCTDSGSAALQLVKDLKRRGSEVALFLVDQRMPAMTGLEFLTEARDIYPVARRVLLTAFSDTSVAIEGINQIGVHHYLVKPWHPPEEKLYPTIDEQLNDWNVARPPTGNEVVRVLGHLWYSLAT